MKSDPDLNLPGLAHDLNNVFQTLLDAADRLHGDPRWQEVSSAIFRSVERGQRITNSMFKVGGSARFAAIVDSAAAFIEDPVRDTPNIRFFQEIDPSLELRQGWVWERVLINLFLNSCRAMPQGGMISVQARRTAHGAEIIVADEGCGISKDLLPHVFEPHVSGNGSTGLGLHIVKTIVERDGGAISASNRDRGAEFRIFLPTSALSAEPRIHKATA